MIRLLGTLTGCGLAVALLLLVVGIPQFRAPAAGERQAIVTLPRPTRPVEPTVDAPAPAEATATAADAARVILADETSPPGAAEPVPGTGDTITAEPRAPEPMVAPEEAAPGNQPALTAGSRWYSFWSPFKSEMAANGFVARLQSVTGLDYRIVRVKPGVYEVSFAYRDDDEISGKLSRITAATGLDLAEH